MTDHLHYKKRCDACGEIYEQCRCIGPKVTLRGMCPTCLHSRPEGKPEGKPEDKQFSAREQLRFCEELISHYQETCSKLREELEQLHNHLPIPEGLDPTFAHALHARKKMWQRYLERLLYRADHDVQVIESYLRDAKAARRAEEICRA